MSPTATRSPEQTLAWAGDGAAHLRGLMTRMGDDAFRAPSALPGWSRAHVLTHIARNADALINLLTWACTGVPTPAYPSQEARDSAIETGAKRPPAEIRADVAESSDRLADVVRRMPKAAWSAHVTDRRGREILASEIPWMRAREMWIHSVDLDVGASFADLPGPMLAELLSDATATMGGKPDCPGLRLVTPEGREWPVGDQSSATTVSGPPAELAAWLLGRSKARTLRVEDGGKLPPLPTWL